MATYPVPLAGRAVTADFLTAMLPLQTYKQSNEDRQSTATLADDSELFFDVAASAVYHVKAYIHYATPTAAGFKVALGLPSGASGNMWVTAVGDTQNTAFDVLGDFDVQSATTARTWGNRASSTNQLGGRLEAIITTSSAGTLSVQWAQTTSTAANTRVAAGSSLWATRIA